MQQRSNTTAFVEDYREVRRHFKKRKGEKRGNVKITNNVQNQKN
jgi:hypothetical protein